MTNTLQIMPFCWKIREISCEMWLKGRLKKSLHLPHTHVYCIFFLYIEAPTMCTRAPSTIFFSIAISFFPVTFYMGWHWARGRQPKADLVSEKRGVRSDVATIYVERESERDEN